jgi:cell wall-associated NlpC family hydrolase
VGLVVKSAGISMTPLSAALSAAGAWVAIPLVTLTVMLTSAPGASLATVIAASGCGPGGGPGGGTVAAADGSYDAEQMTIARTIVDTTAQRGLPRRAAVLAVATAIVESQLRNLDYGDRDSLGVFQQRPTQGWGSPAQVRDPVYATNAFLDRLVAIDGWQHMPNGTAEQRVQRSGFPERYAPQHPHAEAIVTKFWHETSARPSPRSVRNRTGPSSGAVDQRTSSRPRDGAQAATGCPDTDTGDTVTDTRVGARELKQLPRGFTLPRDRTQRAAVSYAVSKIGRPYVWGAKGPDAFDCSGLMMAAWAHAGVAISASTTTQIHDGRAVPGLGQLQPGDLVFIPGSLGTPSNPRHVGLYIGHGLLINAYDQDSGVIVERLSAWKAEIVAIRRVHQPATSDTPGAA